MCSTSPRRSALEATWLVVLFATGLVTLLGISLVAFGVAACTRCRGQGVFGWLRRIGRHYAEPAVRLSRDFCLAEPDRIDMAR